MEDNEVINAHITVIKRIVKIYTHTLLQRARKKSINPQSPG